MAEENTDFEESDGSMVEVSEKKPQKSENKERSQDSAESRLERAMLGGRKKEEIDEHVKKVQEEMEEKSEEDREKVKEIKESKENSENEPPIFALRTTANREDQVMDFITGNLVKKTEIRVYSVIRPHGMRGYIFVEAETRQDAELSAQGIPYARGILPAVVKYNEIEHMLEQVKHEVDIRKNDIAEIISGPFKREKCKITRIDKAKEEVVVELLEAAVPIPITVKMDAVKVIRRDNEETKEE
ncbi:transcription elongation factor Spt5 [Candidatus Woesearchaeota archaeon CG10_big_fil_rev_8_21_14_0_10_44_13]|nr:MAG: transcription elongation factor Spt5 [Candidatus Woesearchaeota archaeon CG10_big_fil_rev_8_21_14_0_10_44_13]